MKGFAQSYQLSLKLTKFEKQLFLFQETMSRTMSRPSPRVYPPPPQQSQQRLVNGYADMEPIGGMDTIARTARVPPPKIFSAGPSAQVRRIESFTESSTLKISKLRYVL